MSVARGRDAGGVMATNTTREALITESLWDAGQLVRQVEALAPALDESRQKAARAAQTASPRRPKVDCVHADP